MKHLLLEALYFPDRFAFHQLMTSSKGFGDISGACVAMLVFCMPSQAALEVQLKQLGLEATGNKETLISRLLGAYTNQQALENQESAAIHSKVVTTKDLVYCQYAYLTILQFCAAASPRQCPSQFLFLRRQASPELPCTCCRLRMRRLLRKCTFCVVR